MLRAESYKVNFDSFFEKNSHCAPKPQSSGQSFQLQREEVALAHIRLFHIVTEEKSSSFGCLLAPDEIKDEDVLPKSDTKPMAIEINIRTWVPSEETLKNEKLVVSVKTIENQGVDSLPVTLTKKNPGSPFYEKNIDIKDIKISPRHSQKRIDLQIDGYSIKSGKWDKLNAAMKKIFDIAGVIAKGVSGISFPGSTSKLASLLNVQRLRDVESAFSAIQKDFNVEKRNKLRKIVSSSPVTFILDTKSRSKESDYSFAKGYWIAIDLPTKHLKDFKECQPKILSLIEGKPLLSFQEKGEETTCEKNYSDLDYLVFEIGAEERAAQ